MDGQGFTSTGRIADKRFLNFFLEKSLTLFSIDNFYTEISVSDILYYDSLNLCSLDKFQFHIQRKLGVVQSGVDHFNIFYLPISRKS